MRVYVDTSVTLRVLFREPDPLPEWGQWTEAYASRLWHTEALRTLDRLRLMAAIGDKLVVQHRCDIELIQSVFHIIPVTDRILARAGESFPTVIGTLDAIHLAIASCEDLSIVTLDHQLYQNARKLDIEAILLDALKL